jgi:hypothetical protein
MGSDQIILSTYTLPIFFIGSEYDFECGLFQGANLVRKWSGFGSKRGGKLDKYAQQDICTEWKIVQNITNMKIIIFNSITLLALDESHI